MPIIYQHIHLRLILVQTTVILPKIQYWNSKVLSFLSGRPTEATERDGLSRCYRRLKEELPLGVYLAVVVAFLVTHVPCTAILYHGNADRKIK